MSRGPQGCGLLFDRQLPCGARGNINNGIQRIVESKSPSPDGDDDDDSFQEKEELDKYLASSIKALSVEDRTTALEEVHGVARSREQEDSSMLKQRLEEMELHLTKMKIKGTAYDTALNENSQYVKNRNLRLMFLRSNRYDSKPAAEQIIKFFEIKKTLFGAEKLTKDILFQDLSADDKKCLEEGSIQILPAKDSISRTILLVLPGLRSHKTPVESEARARFYVVMKTIRNSEDIQRKGMIAVAYTVDEYQDTKKGAGAQIIARTVISLPVPWAGIHFCCGYNDFKSFWIMRAVVTLLPPYLAPKCRVHFGSHLEVGYALRGFGIPDGFLPISPVNSASLLRHHKDWLLQSAFEDNQGHTTSQTNQLRPKSPNKNLIMNVSPAVLMVGRPGESISQEPRVTPFATDVLLGHGFKLNPGNLKLHDMIRDIVDDYDAAERKGDKMSISYKIVDDCKASGSRFLSFDGKTRTWSIVTDKVARNKVAKAIRNRRRSVEGKLILSRHGHP